MRSQVKSTGEPRALRSATREVGRADPNYHVENFKIINALTGEEYR
jgi:hypothetical protein